MPVVERILLIINRTAGTGQGDSVADQLRSTLADCLDGRATVRIEIVDDHPAVKACVTDFLAASSAPAAIIAGGGGGTLRAVIEGICRGSAPDYLPGPDRVRVGALRMGSGNVLARQFGAPKDPVEGLKGIIANLQADRTACCCVMQCEIITPSGDSEIHYGVTLGGFGQFGRVPGDLARWHNRLPALQRLAARLLGIENLTSIEYALALLIRSLLCAIVPGFVDKVEVQTSHGKKSMKLLAGKDACAPRSSHGKKSMKLLAGKDACAPRSSHGKKSMKLLAGLAMNFPFKAIPIDPGVGVEDEAISLQLIPLKGRLSALSLVVAPQRLIRRSLQIRIERSDCVRLKLIDRPFAEFFLDEDPMVFYQELIIKIAGSLPVVPGPEYSWSRQEEITV